MIVLTACASPSLPPPEAASVTPAADFAETVLVPATETAPATETPEPTDTLAPYEDDTPSPPTIAAPVVASPVFTSLRMFNELDGWAISESAVLRTTDGGLTWYNVSPQGVTEFGFNTASAFLNSSQAWVLLAEASDPMGSGLLYRTSDGGLNWIVDPVPFGGGDLAFLDENDGWMMAYLGVAAGSMGVTIYKTDDGGATWTQAYTNDPNLEDVGDSLPLGGIKNNLSPIDDQTAWVGGVVYAPETSYLSKPSDGGQTWAPPTLPAAPNMQDAGLSIDNGPMFPTPDDGILAVRFSGETMRTGFYVTHDAGVDWEFVAYLPGAGEVDFVSPTDGFFWNGEQFFVTDDAAQTWTTVIPDVAFGESFAGMDFVNTKTGWVRSYDLNGQSQLYKTTDGGATWFLMGS